MLSTEVRGQRIAEYDNLIPKKAMTISSFYHT